jgi:ligand-binding sensor domain-containing protein
MFLIGDAYAQNFPSLRFSHLTEKEGLSNNTVSYLLQDNEGFIWVGTLDGLNRFDGYKVHSFYHIPGNDHSLVSNAIYELFCDKQNHIWISTEEGLSRYDKGTGLFSNFRHNSADSNSLSNDQTVSVFIDDSSTAWVSTYSAMYHFDADLHYKKVDIQFKRRTLDNQATEMYSRITKDRQNQLWAGGPGSVCKLDNTTMRVEKEFGHLHAMVVSIYQDSYMQYWLGTFGEGVCRFNPETGRIDHVHLEDSVYAANSITEWTDQNNFKWIVVGTDRGLILIDPVSLKNKKYLFQPGNLQQNSLSGNSIVKVFVDRQNILWVATDKGVSYIEPYKQLFDEWGGDQQASSYSGSDYVYSASQNSQGMWVSRWIANALFFVDQAGNLKKKIPLNDSLKSYYLLGEGDSVLWFTTDQFLVHYNVYSNSMKIYKPPDGYEYTGLRTIVPVDAHTWWIRTKNNGPNGAYTFDPIERKFKKHYPHFPGCTSCPPPQLTDIFLSSRKELYFTSLTEGLYKYDPAADNFTPVLKFEGKELPGHSNGFNYIAEDKKGILWIGTYRGLIAFDPVAKKIIQDYTADHLIGGLEIVALCFDEKQNIWMNTQRGIFCMIDSSHEVRQFSSSDGLPNNTANGFLFMSGDHYMYSSLKDFMVRFNPDKLLNNPSQLSDVHFSEASVMDRPYFFRFNTSGQKTMVIEPGENRFSVDFSVMNYNVGNNNEFFYRLGGVMNAWQKNENGHLVFYGLSPGAYDLHVKGANKNGSLAGQEDILLIVVQPYWWQTLWFRLVGIGLIALLAVVLIRRRISNIRSQASYKQKLAETEMMAMRTQMNPHFIFNSLNSIENFIMQNQKRQASDYLNKFARLIRMILENSREDVVTVANDLEALQLYVDLELLRFNYKFSYKTCIDKELLDDDYRVPPLLIQPFVENAIVHGLANSDKPDLFLNVVVKLEGDYIKYTIEDNGIGREQAAEYKTQNKPNHKSMGMKITRERINLFNQQRQANNAIAIIDLYNEHHQPMGTRVEITIKPV